VWLIATVGSNPTLSAIVMSQDIVADDSGVDGAESGTLVIVADAVVVSVASLLS
jgi:hypothetical protein